MYGTASLVAAAMTGTEKWGDYALLCLLYGGVGR